MKITAIGIVCAALAAPLVWSPNARAVEPAADIVAKQRVLFEQGNTLYDAQRWPEARDAFLAAWKLKRSYDVAANLGDVELLLGEARSAAEHLAYALREFPAGGKPALRATLTKRFDEARRLVGALRIQVSKPGAEVFVDGRSIGYAPIDDEVFVEPGTHQLTAQREGYTDATVSIEAKAGGASEVTLTLEPAAAPAVTAKLPEATVVQPAHSAEEYAGGPRRAMLIGGAATAGAAAVAGVVFTVLAVAKGDEAESQRDALVRENGPGACTRASAPAACSDLRDADDAHIRAANGAILSFAAAGAIGAGTAIYWLATRPSASQQGVRAMPVVGASGFGVSVSGEF
jgi:hypothetical protein